MKTIPSLLPKISGSALKESKANSTDSKIKIGGLTDNISDDISAEAYDEWTEVLDTIEELIEDVESAIKMQKILKMKNTLMKTNNN